MNKKVTTTLLGLAILSAGMIPVHAQDMKRAYNALKGFENIGKTTKIPDIKPIISSKALKATATQNIRALSTFPILSGQEVLIRVDYNVPIEDGKVADNNRIKETLETLRYVLSQGGKAVLISHAGRPKGEVNLKYSLRPMFEELQQLLPEYKGYFATDCVGPEAKQVVQQAKNGEFVLLENLRFHPEEEANDPAFAKQLADLVKSTPIFVEEAFGTVHRAHASTVGVAQYLPAMAGFLVEKELAYLNVLRNSEEPMAVVFGGSKLGDKIPVIKALVENPNVKAMFFGGGIGYTLLKAKGVEVGKSLVDDKNLEVAKEILAKAEANGIEVFLAQDFRLNATGEFIPTAKAQE
ncbi:MAG: phosphoglycerate kinase, partial [Elusimicrobiaceae bacterium]|nr:phosphoglycerate kinase [Elusimicrobiaceae bacterium]